MRAGIALGSNLGDRLFYLQEGKRNLLSLHDGTGAFLCSKIYETPPVDCPEGSPPFLNAVIELSTEIPASDLLARLQQIENDLGRPPVHGFHSPRTLDLDLLYLDDMQLSHASLILPHPQIASRLFVLKPLSDICPNRVLSNDNRNIRSLCDTLELETPPDKRIKFLSFF